jgi:hypothetical protein
MAAAPTRALVALIVLTLSAGLLDAQQIAATQDDFAGTRIPSLTSIVAMDSGDFDGDGLTDLAVGTFDDVWVLRSLGGGAVDGTLHPHPNSGTLYDLTAVEWNGDGQLDVAVARSFAPLSVLLGDGTGGPLGVLDLIPPLQQNRALAAADIDSDGNADLLLSQFSPDQLLVLLGDGAGGVASQTSTPAQEPLNEVDLVDLNGDGDLDVVGVHTHFSDSAMWTWFGDGMGQFSGARRYTVLPQALQIEAGDVDGDGAPDLVTRSSPTDGVRVWSNLGNGLFGTPTTIETSSPSGVLLADLDGDGHDDLLVSTEPGSVLYHRSDGAGAFATPVVLETCDRPALLLALHLDDDGLLDLAVQSSHFDGLTLHTGLGTGGLRLPQGDGLAGYYHDVALADLDGDGWDEAIIAHGAGSQVFIRGGTGTERFGEPTSFPTGGSSDAVAVGDVTADGLLDVVVALEQLAGGVAVLAGDGAGGLGPASFYATGQNTTHVELADMDEDGSLDVLTADKASNKLTLLIADGAGGFGAPASWPTGAQPRDVGAGDLDGDTVPDAVVVAEGSTQMTVLIGRGGGTGDLDLASPVDVGSMDSYAVDLGDVDLDGDLDVCLAARSISRVKVFANDGAAGFSQTHNLATTIDPRDVAIVDIDLDGEPDLVTVGSGGAGFHRGRDLVGFFPVSVHHAAGGQFPTPTALACADLEGSGYPDLVIVGTLSRLSVVPNRGSPWWRLEGGVADGPVLSPVGALTPGSALTLDAWNGPAFGALWIVLGLTAENLPFGGGTLVPSPDVLLPLPLDGDGELHLPLVWPGDLPPGIPFWLQPWLASPHTPGDALLGVTR